MKKFVVRDEFTQRLLDVHKDLAVRGAIPIAKEFTDAILMANTIFPQVQDGYRNYPKDDLKRKTAKENLLSKYNVNPQYLNGNSNKMYIGDPPKAKRGISGDAVKINFRDKKQKQQVIDERDHYKNLYEETLEQLQILQEELEEYKTKSDNKADKTANKSSE